MSRCATRSADFVRREVERHQRAIDFERFGERNRAFVAHRVALEVDVLDSAVVLAKRLGNSRCGLLTHNAQHTSTMQTVTEAMSKDYCYWCIRSVAVQCTLSPSSLTASDRTLRPLLCL